MDFNEVTDQLSGRVTLQELADELGCALQSLKQARMDRSSPHYRKPLPGWEAAAAKLARKRGKELEGLAKKLEDMANADAFTQAMIDEESRRKG